MKKIFPAILLPTLFATFLVSQFFINGNESGASKSENEIQKNHFLEYELKKITGTLLNGEMFDKSNLENKYIIINFWASWCIPCIPKLEILQGLPEKIKVISVNMDDNSTIQKAKKIVKEKNLSFPVIEDQENTLGDKFLVKTLPYSLFFESGKLVKIFSCLLYTSPSPRD